MEFASFNTLVLANIFGHHKASTTWTWHSPNGQHHNHIDYILVRKRFRPGVNIARTRRFPGADIGSDHDLLMMTFCLRPKKHQQAKTYKTQVWPQKAEKFQCVGNLPSFDRREVRTSYHHEQRRYRHRFNDHHLQQSPLGQWDPRQTSSEEKNTGQCKHSWSVRQKEKTEKEKI